LCRRVIELLMKSTYDVAILGCGSLAFAKVSVYAALRRDESAWRATVGRAILIH
jgi:hypothetical protein